MITMINQSKQTPVFQMFECQNPDCCLRFPTNLSVEIVVICPFCKNVMESVGEPFQNSISEEPHDELNSPKIHVLLDNLRSVFNVGSIFRTANGAAVAHIYCCGTTPTPEHAKFIKSGLGSEETISWTYSRNGLKTAKTAMTQGFHVASLEISGNSDSIFGLSHHMVNYERVLLVVGNEVSGIDPEILALSENRIHIPMLGTKTSLNVSIAAAIAMYAYRFKLIRS
jgi:23S rRNA (guanosine2251-2'-O)-methyltransferase